MARPRLSFYCRRDALVSDPHALDRSHRRFVGRRLQETAPGMFNWVPTGQPETLDYHTDLLQACFDGDLWAADEVTAKACRVGFDPTFGGEETETIKAFRARLAGEVPATFAEGPKDAEPPKAEAPKAEATTKPAKPGGKGDL